MDTYTARVAITYSDGVNVFDVAQITGSSLYFRDLPTCEVGKTGTLTIVVDDRTETHSVTISHRSHKCYGYIRG